VLVAALVPALAGFLEPVENLFDGVILIVF